ncbi:MAG: MBL fold metallo-hydrolase [Niastella sp.]|nr:MBL fold metallo-hydrolase [Niastella sp.]
MLHIKSFVFSPFAENTYIIYDDAKNAMIIDPGCYDTDEKDKLSTFIKEMDLKPQMLLNTHCHLDHIFGNKYVTDTYHLIPHFHANEKMVMDLAPAAGLMYGVPFDQYTGQVHLMKDDETVQLGDAVFETLYVPGHSPGHLCFYYAPQSFLIAGDTLFHRSIGRTDLPGGDHQQLLSNIRTKLFALPGDTVVHSGHGPVTTIAEEKAENPFVGASFT